MFCKPEPVIWLWGMVTLWVQTPMRVSVHLWTHLGGGRVTHGLSQSICAKQELKYFFREKGFPRCL